MIGETRVFREMPLCTGIAEYHHHALFGCIVEFDIRDRPIKHIANFGIALSGGDITHPVDQFNQRTMVRADNPTSVFLFLQKETLLRKAKNSKTV